MRVALVNGRVLSDAGPVEGRAVVLNGAGIEAVVEASDLPTGLPRQDLEGGLLAPGFIDTQVNGGGGVLFNDAPSVKAIAAIGAAYRPFGTTGFLPTLISDDRAVIAEAVAAVDRAMDEGVPGLLGIHIEGPFLSAARRGIHRESKLRVMDVEDLALLTSLKRGRTLVTLAPETTTPEAIRQLVAAGVIVAAGHTDADYETLSEAFGNGVTGVTHLFNCMSPMTSRRPGAVGAALENQTAWCGLIADGRHVSPVVLRLALRARPLDRFMLVTDGMPTVGLAEKRFVLQGLPIHVEEGVCVDAGGVLAGADLDMSQAYRNAVSLLGLSLAEASILASAAPAAFLGMSQVRGRIAPGLQADLVLLDEDLVVRRTWIGGASD